MPSREQRPQHSILSSRSAYEGQLTGDQGKRPNIRTIPLSKFEKLGTIEQVVVRLSHFKPS